MNDHNLIQPIETRGEEIAQDNLRSDETVLIKLQGSYGQVLIVTDKHIYIIKWGFMADSSLFGGRCLAFSNNQVTGVTITKNLLTGIIEFSTPSHQDAQYGKTPHRQINATKADNAITFNKSSFESFQKAVNLIRELINQTHSK